MAATAGTTRASQWAELAASPEVEVLIIGAGINGIATFRDLALQNVSVLVVDTNDFGSGASAASSHMVHGGVRYLENGEFRLVKESLQERNRLLRNAPHLVTPLPTVIPIFSLFSGIVSAPLRLLRHSSRSTKERGALLIKLGLLMYDTFGRAKGALPRHHFFGKKKSLADIPGLNPAVKYTAHYFDAAMAKPERLALDVLQDGQSAGPHAKALNYVAATGTRGKTVTITDQFTGDTIDITAHVVVNTSGPWTDVTNRALGIESAFMGGTKGSHIVVDHPELYASCRGREIFFENTDGRIVLIYPVHNRVLIGTTDIAIDNPDDAVCTEEEVDYFFDLVRHVFPDYPLDRSHIVYRYSGVRPLPAAGDLTPGMISRDYRVVHGALASGTPLISLVGGKWTTFRALGEHLANDVLALLKRPRLHSTSERPIGGGRDYPVGDEAQRKWVDAHRGHHAPERTLQLLRRYGTTATEFLGSESPGEPFLDHTPGYTRSEILTLVAREHVVTLADVVYRRTGLGFSGLVTRASAKELAAVIGSVAGWDESAQQSEVDSLRWDDHHHSAATEV